MLDIEQESNQLKLIINDVFHLDVMKKNRCRELVEVRYVYAKILRERGHTLKSISRSIGKDHTTVIYYLSQVDHILKQDSQLAEAYMQCKNIFLVGKSAIPSHIPSNKMTEMIERLTAENDKLILERERVLEIKSKYNRLQKIIDLVDKRTLKGQESAIRNKINNMFNDIFDEDE